MRDYDKESDRKFTDYNTLWTWSLWLILLALLPTQMRAQVPPCQLLPDTLTIASSDCDDGLEVCLPISLDNNAAYDIWVDGLPYSGIRTGCDFDTANVYFLGLVINGGIGPYELRWTVNSVTFTAIVPSFQAVADSMNVFDPLGGWVYDPAAMTIIGGAPGRVYSPIRLEFLPINSPATIGFNQIVTANGTQIVVPASATQVIVRDTALTCADTAHILAFCATNDTLAIRLSMGQSTTVCLDTSELVGTISLAQVTCQPDTSVASIGALSSTFCLSANAAFTGMTAFCVVLCDDAGLCDTTVVRLTITPRLDTFSVTFPILDTSTFCLPTSQLLASPTLLTDLGCSVPNLGTYQLADSCIRYAAGSLAGQSDTLCLVLTDALGWSDTTILLINVTDSVNLLPPVAMHDIHAAFAGRPIQGQLLTNDLSLDGDSLAVLQMLDAPQLGALTFHADGRFAYQAGNALGRETMRYRVCDLQMPTRCDTATLTVHIVAPLQVQPVAMGDHGRVPSGASTSINLLSNDLLLTDTASASFLNVSLLRLPALGTATLSNGLLTYLAPPNGAGIDSLTYELCYGTLCDTGSITLRIVAPTPPNNQPSAVDDAFVTRLDAPLLGNVRLNDWDSDMNSLSANLGAVLPSHGSVTLQNDGSFRYVPDGAFVGTVRFTYQLCDNGAAPSCDSATAYILVTDRVVTQIDTVLATLEIGTDSTFCLETILGDTFTLQNLGCATAAGTVMAISDSCFTYQAPATPLINDTLCLTLTDSFGNVDTTIYVISTVVTPFSLPTDTIVAVVPVASLDTFCVSTTGLVGNLLNSTISLCSSNPQGSITVLSDTCFTYHTPVVGSDTVCVVINDEFGIIDTTVFVIKSIDLRPDTLFLTLNNSTDTVICLDDVLDFETPILSIQDLGCSPLDQTLAAILGTSGCLRLVTNLTAGSDTLCIVACSALGYCDTTYIIVQVAAHPDTLFQTLNTGDTLVHCFPNSELTGAIDTLQVIQAPMLASHYTAIYDAASGQICVTYTATNQSGVGYGHYRIV